ncbi:hypothetical protein KF707_04185 [Candidatus Obscuribacterales bacterium]|jgi:hypothetical protein|nr:hypothetical protein [Candidatus Obscuribacterales bacterium]MBX3135407.1 hypothetical protein [Candidatus Obscuribacterales bacterium]MBX3149263.1 hypothetical protein [Candidatus Obscuribacterales bacterium]
MLGKETIDSMGTLVLGTGLVSPQQLDEAKKTAKNLNVSLERALIMLKMMPDSALGVVLEAHQLVQSNTVSIDLAVRAIRLARQHNMGLQDAIGVLGSVHKKTGRVATITTPLTDLLLSCSMVSMEQVGRAVTQAQDTGMQTGRILVLNRDVSSWMMQAALNALILARDGKITQEQAKDALNAVGHRRISVEQALFELGLYVEKSGQTAKIGELIAMAGFVSESDLLECLEVELVKEKQFGQILLEQGLVTHDLLETAIVLQDMVANGTLRAYQAAEALRQVKDRQVSVYQAVAELDPPAQAPQKTVSPYELLVRSGVADESKMSGIVDPSENSSIKVGKKVLGAGIISESFLYLALRTYSLYKQGFLSADQAVKALAFCKEKNVSLDEALSKLGWFVPARMQWIWT